MVAGGDGGAGAFTASLPGLPGGGGGTARWAPGAPRIQLATPSPSWGASTAACAGGGRRYGPHPPAASGVAPGAVISDGADAAADAAGGAGGAGWHALGGGGGGKAPEAELADREAAEVDSTVVRVEADELFDGAPTTCLGRRRRNACELYFLHCIALLSVSSFLMISSHEHDCPGLTQGWQKCNIFLEGSD